MRVILKEGETVYYSFADLDVKFEVFTDTILIRFKNPNTDKDMFFCYKGELLPLYMMDLLDTTRPQFKQFESREDFLKQHNSFVHFKNLSAAFRRLYTGPVYSDLLRENYDTPEYLHLTYQSDVESLFIDYSRAIGILQDYAAKRPVRFEVLRDFVVTNLDSIGDVLTPSFETVFPIFLAIFDNDKETYKTLNVNPFHIYDLVMKVGASEC